MSYRRSISFSENEKDLRDYFDNNGKSDIVKAAMRFYRDNKDKVLTDSVLNELMKMIGKKADYVEPVPSSEKVKEKGFKMIK